MNDHDANIDLLRVAGTFAVVWLHVCAMVVTSPNMHSTSWWAANIFDSMVRWCVPIFVMVSGALLLSEKADAEIVSFYKRRILKILIPLIFWTVFYSFLRECGHHRPSALAIALDLVHGQPYYHLWYLYMIVSLYLVTPFLRQIIRGTPTRVLFFFVACAFLLAATETTLQHLGPRPSSTFFSSFLPFIPYFVAGYLMFHQAKRTLRMYYFFIAVSSAMVIAFGTAALFIITTLGSKSWEVMYSYLNPIVIVMSLAIFRAGLDLRLRPGRMTELLRQLAPITFGIYLIHPFWLVVLGQLCFTPFAVHPLFGIPLTAIAAFVLSTLSARILAGIPLLSSIVGEMSAGNWKRHTT